MKGKWTKEQLHEYGLVNAVSLCNLTGFEDALLGVSGSPSDVGIRSVYSYEMLVDICMTRDGMTHEDAREYVDFNVAGIGLGKNTPIIVATGADLTDRRVDLTDSNEEPKGAMVSQIDAMTYEGSPQRPTLNCILRSAMP